MVSTPKPPNPYDQAAAQQSSDLYGSAASSIINNANEVNPYGSVSYKNLGYETLYDAKGNPTYVPRYERNVQLSPDQMKLLGLQTQAQGNAGQAAVTASSQLANMFKTPLSTGGLQNWSTGQAAPTLATSFGGQGEIRQDQAPTDRKAVEQAMMSRYLDTANKQNTAQDVQLAARGLNPGSAQYSSVDETRQKALTDAQTQAFLASGQESRAAQDAYNQAQQQRYQEAMGRAGFANTAATQQYQMGSDYAAFLNNLRQAQLQERMGVRNQLPNEIGALMGMGQVTVPQFQPFSRQGVNAAPVGQYMQDAYQSQLQAANAANQGIFGLGSAAVGGLFGPGGMFASDRRLKEDIEPVGSDLAGAPLYWFRYRSEPQEIRVGVMADEVRPIHPDAVIEVDGFDVVDYGVLHSRQEVCHG